jgi:aspartokinase
MSKVRLGGIKAFEKRAYLTSLCRSGDDALGDICSRLAAEHINLSLLTHIADTGTLQSITAASTENAEGFSSYILWKASHGQCSVGKLLTDISTISIFPHDQKLNITGSLLGALAENGIRPYGFASSPSAMTILVRSSDFESVIYRLFDAFEFPTYASPLDWHAAYRGQEDLLSEIICSYEEEVIKIYNLNHHIGLDLWNMALPLDRLGDFGRALLELDQLQMRMPLLVSKSFPESESLYFAYSLAATCRNQVKQALDRNLPGVDVFCQGPVSVFLLHGPHFGDRYGIANAFVNSLRSAGIAPLAMSCAVSSVSAAIAANDSNRAIEALSSSFQIPARKPDPKV